MANGVRHFKRLLTAELEDLIEDIGLLEEHYRERFAGEEITPYVFQENEALLIREIDSINKFIQIVDGIDTRLYKDTSSLETDLTARAKALVDHLDDPEAVYLFIKRKIDKVHMYLATGEASPGIL
ncbi:MAG: hypothetical protein A3J97_14055 [Spirochaetes bacterium RIFOXYC1_FULL_54_7]|nr:MAG: hypothetical protein A3J97_14055 [Spirochaetes bacterium RIFOXYC1_FULL_54_7]